GLSLFAAILLIVPGFLTSTLGLLLLIPMTQRLAVALLGQRLAASAFTFRKGVRESDDVIDAEFEVVPDPRNERLPPSKWTQG
ncbi:MAG: FxsA cytoplasmic rane protein, partial [Pseudomonadota bacterium]